MGSSCGRSISSTILQGIKCQEDDAWNRLYTVWHPAVYARCRRAGVPPHDAEEIVQNVFLKVSRGIDTFQRQSFRAWLYAITQNAITDHHRSRRNRPAAFGGTGSWIDRIQGEDPSPCGVDGADCPADAQAPVPEDSDQYIVHQLLEVIRKDFEHATFEAFRRTVMDDRRPVDVAKELGMTPEAVRAAKYRILKRLREESQTML